MRGRQFGCRYHGEFTLGCWTKDRLFDMREAEEHLQQATADATILASDYKNASILASAGDFDSLLRLVDLIGHDSRLTFALSTRSRGNLSSVQAFSIRIIDANNLSYRTRGVVSRNRQHLTRQDFHSLLAVRSL
jgi:hypothetical protein